MKNKIFYVLTFILLTGCSSVNKISSSKKKEDYKLLKGMNYTREENYNQGLKEYEKIYKTDKNNPIILKELGKTYARLENYDDGIKYYKKALKIDKKDKESMRNLSYLYFLKGDFKTSFEYIERLSQKDRDFETRKFRSYLLYKNKKYKEAYQEFKNIQAEDTNFDLTYSEAYIEILDRLNKKDEIKSFLEKGIKENSANEEFIILYSCKMGEYFDKYNLGEREIKRYISSYGGSRNLYITLAQMAKKQKNDREEKTLLKLIPE